MWFLTVSSPCLSRWLLFVAHVSTSCVSWSQSRALHSLMQAYLHCRLYYCNSALAGVAKVYLQKLQSVPTMADRMVSGVTPKWTHHPSSWRCVSQRVVFKTALMVWKYVHGVAPAYLMSSASAICSDWHSTCSTRPDCSNWTRKFRSERTSHIGTVCHQHYVHRTCRRALSSGHWKRTCSQPLGTIEKILTEIAQVPNSAKSIVEKFNPLDMVQQGRFQGRPGGRFQVKYLLLSLSPPQKKRKKVQYKAVTCRNFLLKL